MYQKPQPHSERKSALDYRTITDARHDRPNQSRDRLDQSRDREGVVHGAYGPRIASILTPNLDPVAQERNHTRAATHAVSTDTARFRAAIARRTVRARRFGLRLGLVAVPLPHGHGVGPETPSPSAVSSLRCCSECYDAPCPDGRGSDQLTPLRVFRRLDL